MTKNKKRKKEYIIVMGRPIITFTNKKRAKQYIKTGNKINIKGQNLYLIKKENKKLEIIQ